MKQDYNLLSDRLTAGEYMELQTALEVILRLTVGKMEGPTRVPCEASLRFEIEGGLKRPLAVTVRTLD